MREGEGCRRGLQVIFWFGCGSNQKWHVRNWHQRVLILRHSCKEPQGIVQCAEHLWFCVCWSANFVSILASQFFVSSEVKSIFSEVGEGNSGGVTACSLDDAPEKVWRQLK